MPTLAENLVQLNNDKNTMVNNLNIMGVTATQNESMASLASKILNIPQNNTPTSPPSGDTPTGGVIVRTGTFTPSSNISTNYTFNHNVGDTPDFVVIYITNDCSSTQRFFIEIWDAQNSVSDYVGTTGTFGSVTITQSTNGNPQKLSVTETSVTIAANSSMRLNSGTTYAWLAIKF